MIQISELKDLKEKFNSLGLYLIDKAEKEIKELNKKILFQKAEIRKDFIEKQSEGSIKLRKHFIEIYNQTLNRNLSNSLMELKEKMLNLKNKLANDLRKSLIKKLEERIKKNSSKYYDYLTNQLKRFAEKYLSYSEVVLILRSDDYNHFKGNLSKIKSIINKNIELNKAEDEFIGGFKIFIPQGQISYDYSLDYLIDKNSLLIQKELLNIILNKEIKELEQKYVDFIENKKLQIEEYLKSYDRI